MMGPGEVPGDGLGPGMVGLGTSIPGSPPGTSGGMVVGLSGCGRVGMGTSGPEGFSGKSGGGMTGVSGPAQVSVS